MKQAFYTARFIDVYLVAYYHIKHQEEMVKKVPKMQ